MERLKKRKDFLLTAKTPYVWKRPSFVLQYRRQTGESSARVGFTVTKRQGNAVMRNRIKRRLREAVRVSLAAHLKPECDYVFIGRTFAAKQEFSVLQKEMVEAVTRLHKNSAKDS